MRDEGGKGGYLGWEEPAEGGGGDKGQSHTIKLCSVGLQRPASYFHAALNYTNSCLHRFHTTFTKSMNRVFFYHLIKKQMSVAAQRSNLAHILVHLVVGYVLPDYIMSYSFYPNEHFWMIFLSADSEGKLSSPKGSQLVHMALMMHSWVVPSQMFAQKLLTLYPQLSHSLIVRSLCSFAWSHMTRFFNLLRKQAWHCFTLNMLKQI